MFGDVRQAFGTILENLGSSKTSLLVCLYNKQNITCPLVDMKFIFSCSTRYLTRSLRSLVRYRVEHSKIKFISTRTVSQLKGVSDTFSNWFENHRPPRTQISTVTNASFRSKLESNGLQVDRNRKFSERIFQFLQYSGNIQAFRLIGLI